MMQIIFLGKLPNSFRKKRFIRLLKKSHANRRTAEVENVSRVRNPSLLELPDNYVFDLPAISKDAEEVVIVTSKPIQDNFITRSNQAHLPEVNSAQNIVVYTFYEVSDIAQDFGVNLTRVSASAVLLSLYSARYVKQGGDYWDLWIDEPENSVFGFCADKSEIVNKFESGEIGNRVESVLEEKGRPQSEILSLKNDARLMKRRRRDRISVFFFRSHRDVTLAVIFFLFGLIVPK